jgi:hypothetical protein
MEEDQGVAAETTASDSPTETSQPVESAPVSEDANTQPEEAGDGRSVPYDRFKEVNDQLKQFKEAYSQATAQQPSYGQQEMSGETGLDPAAEQKLVDLMGKAVDQRLSGISQFVQEQRSATQIEQMRRQYPDFDQYVGEATKVLTEQKDELGRLKDPLTTAYFIAKGRSTPQAVDAARAAGRDEAYKSIDSKIASRPGSPVPKKDSGGESDILKKFRAGSLSEQETKANWTRLQEELANA